MADPRPDTPDGIHAEGHRNFVGGLWDEIGRLQFDFLIEQGLQPSDFLLDIACGPLRGGAHAIRYLDPGHYLGLDKHIELVIYGVAAELGLSVFREKRPRFVISDRFEFNRFEQRPNFAIAHSLFTHLTDADIRLCLARLADCAAPGCRLFVTFQEVEWTSPNPSISHAHDVFYYTRDEIAGSAARSGWQFRYIGDWGHPRGQRIAELRRPAA